MNFDSLYPDPRDRASLNATPTVMVPRFGKLPKLPEGQIRYLVGRTGMYIEARSKAVHVCLKISHAERLPYGPVSPFFRALGGPIPSDIRKTLHEEARAALPNEYAALVLWDGSEYRIHRPKVIEASEHRIQYASGDIDPQTVVVDVHSHGNGSAFFSGTDDDDDLANPSPAFMAMVLGKVDAPQPQVVTRIVANGRAAPQITYLAQLLPHPWRRLPDDEPTLDIGSDLADRIVIANL